MKKSTYIFLYSLFIFLSTVILVGVAVAFYNIINYTSLDVNLSSYITSIFSGLLTGLEASIAVALLHSYRKEIELRCLIQRETSNLFSRIQFDIHNDNFFMSKKKRTILLEYEDFISQKSSQLFIRKGLKKLKTETFDLNALISKSNKLSKLNISKELVTISKLSDLLLTN